jgi:flagellar hook assembly protein FlgD
MFNLLKNFSAMMYIMSTVSELRILAKTLNVRGYSTAKKADLITLIEKHQSGSVKADIKIEDIPEVKVETVKKSKAKTKEVATAPAPVQDAAPAPVVEKSKRSNDWNNYLAEYRKEHGGTLRDAMAGAKESYATHKESKKVQVPSDDKRPFRDLP